MSETTGRLTFFEYLKQLPSEEILELSRLHGNASRTVLSSTGIRKIADEFSSADMLKRTYESLSAAARVHVATIYFCGDQGLRISRCESCARELLSSRLVYACREPVRGERFFTGFEEFASVLIPLCGRTVREQAVVEHAAIVPEHHPLYCVNDAVVIAGLATRECVKRNKNGALYKATRQTCKKVLHASRSAAGGAADEKAAVAGEVCIGFLQQAEVLFEENGVYCPDIPRLESLLQRDSAAVFDTMAAYARRRCADMSTAIIDQAGCAEGEWISLQRWLGPALEDVRTPLLILGYLNDLSVSLSGTDMLVRPSRKKNEMVPLVKGAAAVTVLPDFSVIIAQEAQPATLFSFLRIGKIVSLDNVYHGAIDRILLFDALSKCVDPAAITGHLETWNAPANVRETVREWIREFGRISLVKDSVLVSTDPQVSRQIAGFEQVRKYLEPVEAHAVFRIRPGMERRVSDVLAEAGFDARLPAVPQRSTSGSLESEVKSHTAAREIIFETGDAEQDSRSPVKSGKYGSELKPLELSDMIRVLEYAMLVSAEVKFEYEGSRYVTAGTWTVSPQKCRKTTDPTFEGIVHGTKKKKTFFLNSIKRMGVLE